MNDWEMKGKVAVRYRRVKNFIADLAHDVLRDQIFFEAEYVLSREPIPLIETQGLERKAIKEGEVWGRTWESGYFLLKAQVPAGWAGRVVAAQLDFGGEGLVYSSLGDPLFSITSGSSLMENYNKDLYRVLPQAQGGEAVELLVETAANNLFGVTESPHPVSRTDPDRHGVWEARVNKIRLCTLDEEVWSLGLDMRFLLELYDDLDSASVQAVRILKALFAVTQAYHEDPLQATACRRLLAPELDKPASASNLTTTVVGHAHIDTAWLWRLQETHRKVARTFANQIDLLERYPDYVFGASSPQHYAWVKKEHPALYSKIKKAVAEGRWELQGGMWIEADCNLPSGESLIRQVLHGKNFWKAEFGVEVKNCWIPDVFGYAASLPQILRKSGIDSFLTQKLSWSKMNEFPHDTFHWQGIDGSRVLTHFPPEYTYNSFGNAPALRRAEKTFHEKADLDEFISLVGVGDGGGGPKEEHIENILRARNLEGLPRAAFGTAAHLFERLAVKAELLETWVGELYLEYHRGTYTTQAAAKKNNRRLEQELRVVEALWSALPLGSYPREALDAVVKTLLLHQFHDIIPGSSIHAVYVDAAKAYEEAFGILNDLKEQAGRSLLRPEKDAWTLFNGLNHPWEGVVTLPEAWKNLALREGDGTWAVQEEEGRVRARVSVPGQGWLTLRPSSQRISKVGKVVVDPLVLENELVRYAFNSDAELVEAWDKKAERFILKPGERGNVLSLYEDTPHNFEAWDIDFYYPQQLLETAKGLSFRDLGRGPVGAALRFDLVIGASRINQTIRLDVGCRRLSFETRVEWNERQRLLRTSFPLDSLAVDAACEIANGYVRRPTHKNTEWDAAKFEVCAHRWVDLGDSRYGVALLNDSKYGHSVQNNVLGLSLLRAPLYPDPDADQGIHHFTYALLPHEGPLESSNVIEEAACLNRKPLEFFDCAGGPPLPLRLVGEGFSLEALKRAEKDEAWIVRVCENRGLGTQAQILGAGVEATLCETDLMEEKDGKVQSLSSSVHFRLLPFEIKTFKVKNVQAAAL